MSSATAQGALGAGDIRALLTLLGELGELGHEPDAWRAHLCDALARFCTARVAQVSELAVKPDARAREDELEQLSCGEFVFSRHARCAGLTPHEQEAFARDVTNIPHAVDPAFPALRELYGASFTRSRIELVRDREWYRSEAAHERYRAYDCDDYVVSMEVVPEDLTSMTISYIALYRGVREPRLGVRERLFIQLLHEELGARWRRGPYGHKLTRRQRQTLEGIIKGLSEKEIAFELGISPHTLHDYVKSLYRVLGVQSRAELHAQYKVHPLGTPRLARDLQAELRTAGASR